MKASDNEFPSLLLAEGAAPATPGAGLHRLFVDSADGLVKRKDDTGTVSTVEGGPGGGGGGTTFNDRRWVNPSAPHAEDDEFRDNDLDAAFVRVDAAGGAGRAAWTEGADVLSLHLLGGDAAGELHALLKPYVLAEGEALECHLKMFGPQEDYFHAGPIVTDGAVHGAGVQMFGSFGWDFNSVQQGKWSGFNSRDAFSESDNQGWGREQFWRVAREPADTWRFSVSGDGVTWLDLGTRVQAMAPTHIGFAGGSWGAGGDNIFSFDYLRVVTP